jgi:polyhydroxybutyrate depolymerase
MVRRFPIALALLLLALCLSARAATVRSVNIATGSGQRQLLLFIPDHFSKPGPYPVVLLLHGRMGSAAEVFGANHLTSPMSLWLKIADREGLLIAALDGAPNPSGQRGWNDCRGDKTSNPSTDDVGFANAVVEALVKGISTKQSGSTLLRGDPHRVFVMGMSNGGLMAFRLAQQMRPHPAGIAVISASMPASTDSVCPLPTVATSVLLIAGDADPIMPYRGGPMKLFGPPRGHVLGAEATAALWVALARHQPASAGGAAATPLEPLHPPHKSTDPTRPELFVYTPKGAPIQVELLRIIGGGHVEPSPTQHYGPLYTRLVGPQNYDVESAALAWSFFSTLRNP